MIVVVSSLDRFFFFFFSERERSTSDMAFGVFESEESGFSRVLVEARVFEGKCEFIGVLGVWDL